MTAEKPSPYRCKDAVLDIVKRMQAQPELKDAWNGMLNAEKNYVVGDLYNIIEKACHSALQQAACESGPARNV